jgi:hypothetical protein
MQTRDGGLLFDGELIDAGGQHFINGVLRLACQVRKIVYSHSSPGKSLPMNTQRRPRVVHRAGVPRCGDTCAIFLTPAGPRASIQRA